MQQPPPPYPGEKAGGPPPAAPYPQQPGYGAPPYQPPPGQPGYRAELYTQQGYQQPYPAQYNAPPQGQTTVVLQQPAYSVVQHFRESPVRIKCQFCQADIVTSTYYETGTLTWVACFVIAIVGGGIKQTGSKPLLSGGYPQGQQYPAGQQYPPGQYPQGQYQQAPTTVVVTQPVALVQQFREVPVHTKCPHCQAEVVTGTSYETGSFTWLLCLGLCVIGCDLGCCLIPFCVDGAKDVVHNCPNCRQMVGRWSRL